MAARFVYTDSMPDKPAKLYHGSARRIEGPLTPVMRHATLDHIHDRAAVFGTERMDIAALFMFPMEVLASIGFEENVAYICIWGTREAFAGKDREGFIYVLPGNSFEKVGKDYEWQNFQSVQAIEIKTFPSALEGMMECGVRVYFVNDEAVFDRIVADKEHRLPILKDLTPERKGK